MTKSWAISFQFVFIDRERHPVPINLGKKTSSGTEIETVKDVYR